jgi:CRISPR/Cas system CSM-associated protein Csm3 (group 7 of RAMP superfamily)
MADDLVEESLEIAKKFQNSNRKKDSVNILGETVSWDELEQLMLELDVLGGSGSRGCGQIKFENITIDGEQKEDNFLEAIELN